MKKILALLTAMLTALLCTLSMTACKKEEEVPVDKRGRIILTVARCPNEQTYFRSGNAKRLITSFNGASKDYFIKEQLYETSDRLLTEITAGNCPDIICLGDRIDASPMIGKGMLCDIYEFIDGDNEVSRDDYIEPVLKALETDGKLYQMPFDFAVSSAVAKKSVWGEETDTTFEHIVEVSEKNGCKIPFNLTMSSDAVKPYITANYIDAAAGTCSFNDGRFEEFLEFSKKSVEIMEDCNTYEQLCGMFTDGEILLMSGGIAGFEALDYFEDLYGEEVEFTGLPSETENYHIVVPAVSFSVFSGSKQKEGAFEFIRYCTSYDTYISMVDGYCLPINEAALKQAYEKSMADDYLIKNEKARKQNRDEIMEQIYSVNGASSSSGDIIFSILSEETELFYSGDKSAADVCEIIQNRLTNYFNEQR